jgi:hypothetical protein
VVSSNQYLSIMWLKVIENKATQTIMQKQRRERVGKQAIRIAISLIGA